LISAWSTPAQLVYTGFCLIGVPITLAGLWGVWTRIEANLRIYFYYLTLCFVMSTVMVAYWCLFQALCDSTGVVVTMLSNSFGEAFICGAVSIASYAAVAVVVIIEVYCLWIVWSMCEDVHLGKNGPELSQLIGKNVTAFHMHKQAGGPEAGIVGFASYKVPGAYPNPYGALTTTGEGRTIFGGTQHETSYPPPQ
jgi:hypothetical protein